MDPVTIRFAFTPRVVIGTIVAAGLWSLLFFSALAAGAFAFGLQVGDVTLTVVGLTALAFFWIGTPFIVLWRWRDVIGRPVEVVFTEDGIRQDVVGRHFQGAWSAVAGATMRGPFVLVKLRGSGTLGIPTSAFATAREAEALVLTIRSNVGGRNGPEDSSALTEELTPSAGESASS